MREHLAKHYDLEQQLRLELEAAGVDLSEWGGVATKNVADLVQEIENGEAIFMWDERGLLRVVMGLGLDVVAEVGGRTYVLREARQVFTDGVERLRRLSTSLGEKIRSGETTQQVVARALSEELGITHEARVLVGDIEEREHPSSSFPGLRTVIVMQYARAVISPADFQPDGYTEVQPKKSTIFSWDEVA